MKNANTAQRVHVLPQMKNTLTPRLPYSSSMIYGVMNARSYNALEAK